MDKTKSDKFSPEEIDKVKAEYVKKQKENK